MILVPLVCKEHALGILGLVNKRAGAFLPRHLRTVSLIANTTAVAIDNARLFEEAQTNRARLERVSSRLVEAQEAERRAIARELHDEIGQALTGLKLILAKGTGGPGILGEERRAEAQALVTDLLSRVRELSLDLRPAVLDDLGLLAALLWHTDRFTRQTGVEVRLQHMGVQGRRFPTAVEIAVFRVVQEALTNVARHAAVQEATVRIWADAEILGANVEDQGLGFKVEAMLSAHRSTGLSAMRERTRLLGGRISVESQPGSGTRITVELPLAETASSWEGEP
jgi:signal transduction histidine kinase